MTEPAVSVVVPVYNGAAYLERTLQSVLAQEGVALELIVVDDGSTDDSQAVVQRVAPHARLLAQPNAGRCAARNRGLHEARGRAVIFLDQDDVWHPDMLARQLARLDADPSLGAAVCRYLHWWPQRGAYAAAEGLWGDDPGPGIDPEFSGWVYHQFLFDCWALTSGTLLRRDVVVAAGGFDESLPFSEDWDLWLRLSNRATFALLTWPPVLYRQHAVQGSRVPRERDWRLELLLRQAREHGLASRDGRAIEQRRFTGLLAQYQFEFAYNHLQHGGAC
jgi:GT2 family glycosyltransferase